MNRKISTRVGLITGMIILSFLLIVRANHLPTNSPWIGMQFLLLLIGLLASCFLLYRYYADIKFLDAFKHCIKTLTTTMAIMAVGNTLLFFILKAPQDPLSNLTVILGYTLFSYSLSGVLSSLFSSFLFNTFTKK
jgi:hypothetical protein